MNMDTANIAIGIILNKNRSFDDVNFTITGGDKDMTVFKEVFKGQPLIVPAGRYKPW